MLVRKFISHRLNTYYSQPSQSVVGGVSEPLPLHYGRAYWLYKYKRLYKQNHGQWLTPVELFQPFYSKVLLNWMLKHAVDGYRHHIVELGPGRGTNAKILLDTLKKEYPEQFANILYTLVDSSTSLLGLQQETLSEFDGRTVTFFRSDLMHAAESDQYLLPPSNDRTVVLALELWDNLPHDKIRMKNGVLEQAEIVRADNKVPLQNDELEDQSIELEEIFVPLSDPLIKDILQVAPEYIPRRGIAWIPSVACGILVQLQRTRRLSSLLIADFDWLPRGDFNATLRRSSALAHAPLRSDILFPTDFSKFATYAKRICGDAAEVKIYKQQEFLRLYGPNEVRATTNWLSGFSPLTTDFDNCSIMTVIHRELKPNLSH
ncbi:hypothetical protein MPSEU_000346900 [Mayamaea pseudoterrestris]|nr:hypothetical protein MPSEU_000346900 [Mayamaea pseudoterrestris]